MYDVIIIGGGPAGVTAGIYCSRYMLKTLILSYNVGGWVNNASIIENLPAKYSITGADLVKNYKEQIKGNNVEVKVKESVTNIKEEKDGFSIKTNKGEYQSKYIIYALGTKKRMLNVPGEGKYLGNGVHTCATCDAPFFSEQIVTVVGANDSGAKTALLLSQYAKKVYLLEFQNKLPAEPMWQEKINATGKIEIKTGVSVKEIVGQDRPEKVILTDDSEIECQGIFIEIGSDPNIALAKKLNLKIDKYNCLEVDASMKTSNDRVYGAGDVTNGSNYLRQIITAQAEGAIAANSIYKKVLQE